MTPLSVILSSTELLEESGGAWSEERKRQHTARIGAAVRGMVEMLDAVLTIGRSDAGADRCAPEPLRVPELCEELVANLRQSAGERHAIELASDGDWAEATMDPRHLRHVLTNLLSNAVKYSPAGGVVRLTIARAADRATFRVSDAGIGIPADDVGRLFGRFVRGGNVGAIAGTGLGLAIVKRSVDACGGTITVASVVGEGTTFVVELPCPRGGIA